MRLTTHQSVMGRNRKHDIAYGMGAIWLKKIGKYKYELIEKVVDKLGQLEDIEEEYVIIDNDDLKRRLSKADKYGELSEQLGIDLEILFKALKDGIYLVDTNVLTKKAKIVKTKVDNLHYWGIKNYRFWIREYATDINIKNYGKSWSLNKEDLQ